MPALADWTLGIRHVGWVYLQRDCKFASLVMAAKVCGLLKDSSGRCNEPIIARLHCREFEITIGIRCYRFDVQLLNCRNEQAQLDS